MNDPIDGNLSVVDSSALQAITRGEIDVQISTAHRFPRDMTKFQKRALEMALLDEETAASCIYCRPVGMKNGQQEYAEGMSIRMAEIVGASYGNLRVGAMLIEQTDRYVKARGFAHDLETNFASSSEVVESTVTKNGDPFSERMRMVVAKATLAKAKRDATFSVVPRALCKPIEREARKVAIGDAKSLEIRRSAVMQWVNKLGIKADRVWGALGIAGEADLGNDQLITLTGLRTAIKDGEVSIEEAFPQIVINQAPKADEFITAPPTVQAPQQLTPVAKRRGRPPGSVNSASEPTATPTEASKAPVVDVSKQDAPPPLKHITHLLNRDGILPYHFEAALRKMNVAVPEDGFPALSDTQLQTAVDDWEQVRLLAKALRKQEPEAAPQAPFSEAKSPQTLVAELCGEVQAELQHLNKWCIETGQIIEGEEFADWKALPDELCNRLIKGKKMVQSNLKAMTDDVVM